MSGHTPEPWVADITQNEDVIIVGGDDSIIAELRLDHPEITVIANGCLIVAAPDLLKAAEHAAMSAHHPKCKHHSGLARCTCHVGKADAAIAKATEEPNQ